MRIAFDVTETCNAAPTGCGHFTRHAVQAMLDMNTRREWGDTFSMHYRASHATAAGLGFCPPGYVLEPLSRLSGFSRTSADIVHGFATHAASLGRACRVVTLFDVFSALDESREWQHGRSRRRKMRQYRRLARQCDMIIAISETTKCDFLRHFDYPEERLRVIHGGVDRAFSIDARKGGADLRAMYGLPERYFLYVGAPVPRKNLPRLIDAYAATDASGEIGLVIAGTVNDVARSLIADVRARELDDSVKFIGYVPDEHLPALYACAEAFLFPTFYEGLGMPVVEAMACGIPVVVGNSGAAPEAGGGYAFEVDPYDCDALSAAIGRALEMPEGDRVRASEYARAFTWENCAIQMHEAYEWMLGMERKC